MKLRYTAGANLKGVKIDRTTPALVRFKPSSPDFDGAEKDYIVAYYLPSSLQVRETWQVMYGEVSAFQFMHSFTCLGVPLMPNISSLKSYLHVLVSGERCQTSI